MDYLPENLAFSLLMISSNGFKQALCLNNGRTKMFKETAELKVLLEIASQLKKIRALLEEINNRDKGKK